MMDEKVILLVEDNARDEELTLLALRKSKVCNEVVVMRDGAEALEYLYPQGPKPQRKQNDFPAVVLLDLKLPKVDGLEVLRRIRADQVTRFIPVIIFTSSNEERDLLDCYGSGCNSFVQKPVDFVVFADTVRQMGLFWVAVNQAAPRTKFIT